MFGASRRVMINPLSLCDTIWTTIMLILMIGKQNRKKATYLRKRLVEAMEEEAEMRMSE
jgi:hypothetical protein